MRCMRPRQYWAVVGVLLLTARGDCCDDTMDVADCKKSLHLCDATSMRAVHMQKVCAFSCGLCRRPHMGGHRHQHRRITPLKFLKINCGCVGHSQSPALCQLAHPANYTTLTADSRTLRAARPTEADHYDPAEASSAQLRSVTIAHALPPGRNLSIGGSKGSMSAPGCDAFSYAPLPATGRSCTFRPNIGVISMCRSGLKQGLFHQWQEKRLPVMSTIISLCDGSLDLAGRAHWRAVDTWVRLHLLLFYSILLA